MSAHQTKNIARMLVVSALLAMTSCAEVITEREGPHIQLVPLTYRWSVDLQGQDVKESQRELYALMEKDWALIANNGVKVDWATKHGKVLANNLKSYLLTRGLDEGDIHLEKAWLPDSKDIQVQFQYMQVVTELCRQAKVGHYGELTGGCFVESNRWHSMANPESTVMLQSDISLVEAENPNSAAK